MGKVYEALLKNDFQWQLGNSQVSSFKRLQPCRFLLGQKIFTERFLLGVCLGLALCNTFVLLLHLFVLTTP